jgi:hypothetical protein
MSVSDEVTTHVLVALALAAGSVFANVCPGWLSSVFMVLGYAASATFFVVRRKRELAKEAE